MADRPAPGLYEQLISLGLDRELARLDRARFTPSVAPPEASELPRLLARYVHDLLYLALEAQGGKDAEGKQLAICQRILGGLSAVETGVLPDDALAEPASLLRAIEEAQALAGGTVARTAIPLGTGDLLVNARGEPGLGPTLQAEIPSADRIDLLCAFIKWNGFRILEPALRRHLERGRPLRVLTTTYIGATERRALDVLKGFGAQVKVSYETRTTRLHAKAWLFERETGFSTAYVGSSNLSHSALLDGLEWNVRLSQVETPALLQKFRATFEGYWEDPQFEDYDPGRDAERFDEALRRARGVSSDTPLPAFELRPFPFQEEILQKLRAERERHGRHRNLVVAATGTGKTVIAAFDYRRLAGDGPRPRLLFVAHRREILVQSLGVFRAVLRDGSFGELYVDGQRPEEGRHVFASVQSLSRLDPGTVDPRGFDVVIVDEFHHAEAPTYRRLLAHLQPREMLGLTATPERADGESVVKWFDGRIAAELRLWEALEKGLLSPFQYFGAHDGVDLSRLRWSRGGYEAADLEKVLTGNDARVAMVVQAIRDRVYDPSRMRALGFCVSVAHAEYMARRFVEAGLPALAVSGETRREERDQALRRLRDREVNVLFAVDLFNEGVDVPEIDTVLFLRPTESVTVFLQQLGRGLRLAEGKSCLTVLDFIGRQHSRFRFDLRLRALTGGTRAQVRRQVEEGFPYLPPGCTIQLDRVASEIVLDNLRESVGASFQGLVQELKRLGRDVDLATFLAETALEPEDLYGSRGWTWSRLRRAAGLATPPAGPREPELGRACGRFVALDDPGWLAFFGDVLRGDSAPDPATCSESQVRMLNGLHFGLWSGREDRRRPLGESLALLWEHPAVRGELVELFKLLDDRAAHVAVPLAGVARWDEPVPLTLHSRYRLDDILAAFGLMTPAHPHRLREGVKHDPATRSDLFFVTLEKSEKHYSPTTRYRDYALSPTLFHWESQSTTSTTSPTGQRYLRQRETGGHVFLFVRERKKDGGLTQAYTFLGPADYESHSGDRPIAIVWRLRTPMPADLFQQAKVAVA